jgi:ABC-type transport system substrate-binding protein
MDINIWGPVFNSLVKLNNWQEKKYVPDLATDWTVSTGPNGPDTRWIVNLRQGVKWHDGWEFTAEDVKATWDSILTPEAGSYQNGVYKAILSGKGAYNVTGKYQITVDLPIPNAFFVDNILTFPISPAHFLRSVPATELIMHPFNKASRPYEVKRPDGSVYTANGPIGTGPFVFKGWDVSKRTATLERFPDYWNSGGGNIKTYKVVTITTADAALAALKAGAIDIIDTNTGIEPKVGTIDPAWGKIVRWTSAMWQQVMYNGANPIFGTGVKTPLGMKDPKRAAEAARYVRQALNAAIPREKIVKEILYGYGNSNGTVAISPANSEYDKTLKPFKYDLELARDLLAKAGYEARPRAPTFWEQYGLYIGSLIGAAVVAAVVLYLRKAKGPTRKST